MTNTTARPARDLTPGHVLYLSHEEGWSTVAEVEVEATAVRVTTTDGMSYIYGTDELVTSTST